MNRNRRLNVIGILFALFYFFIIGEYVFTEAIPGFVGGFKAGMKKAEENYKNREFKMVEFFTLEVVPKSGNYTFPTRLANVKNGESLNADLKKMEVEINNPVKLSAGLHIVNSFAIILVFIMAFLLIFIPVQAYRIIRSIVKNEIFDLRTITRIRRIGYTLLIIFGCNLSYAFVRYLASRQMIGLEEYDVVFSIKDEYIFLLFGLITLLFAEILKISHTMKEEQDLTI